MNANIKKTHFFFIKSSMTSKVIKVTYGHLLLRYIICLTPDLSKKFQECQLYEETNFS